jgi:5-methylcytosine-specific restriction protein A
VSYAAKRPSISKAKRARIFLAHGGICWLCKVKIGADEAYDIDHQVSRELGGSDEDDNLAPAHKDCHKDKTKQDVKAIAKSNRIRRNLDPETRKRSKRPIPSPKKPWPSQKMGKSKWKTNVRDVNS